MRITMIAGPSDLIFPCLLITVSLSLKVLTSGWSQPIMHAPAEPNVDMTSFCREMANTGFPFRRAPLNTRFPLIGEPVDLFNVS